jgi:amino acid adenylation domain-containing protein
VVDAASPVPIPVVEVPADTSDEQLERLAAEEARRPFDLTSGPLFRVLLLRRAQKRHALVCTVHHAVFDGWSRGIFQRELAALYGARVAATAASLPELPLQYGDVAVWQRERLQGDLLEQQLTYWKEQLGGGLPILALPGDRSRSGLVSPEGAEEPFVIPPGLAHALGDLGRSHGVTSFVILLALFQVVLQRYSGLDDIITGTPIANRNRAELENLIGFFVNTIALRTDFSDNPPFTDLLRRVSETTLDAQAHQELPFERLVEDLHPERHLNHHPVFQVMFDWQSAPTRTLQLPGLTMSPWRINPEVARFDLTLSFQEGERGLRGWLEYNSSLFDRSTIRRMADHFAILAQAAVANPSQRVGQLPIMPARERQQVLVEWNDTGGEFPRDRCVHEIFEEQVGERPDAAAVIAPDGELTFRMLNERANRLARYLQQHGVSAGSLVSMFVEKSLDMVVAVLGILKAGAAYVPLDPRYPTDRMAFVLDDTKAPVLLTQERLLDRLPEFSGITVCLDRDWDTIAREDSENPAASARPDDPLYIIYTSGSTGVPKGVEIHHRAFVNLCTTLNEWFALEAEDRMLQLSSIAFDTGSEELLTILLRGGTSVLFPAEMIGSFDRFRDFIEENGITVLDLPTAFWHEWVGALENGAPFPTSVRLVAAGGEAAMPAAFRAWRRIVGTDVRWLNSYGPTETTVTCSLWDAGEDDGERLSSVPIGRPLLNSPLYVLDKHLQPVPVGIPGELYIGGELVGRGYLNRPELTAERFIPDPFRDAAGSCMYKSGDVCRWLPDGNIEFFGRRDHQIKIRGFRIELGEIEAVLGDHREVLQTVAVVHTGRDGTKRIVAYFVPQVEGASVEIASLREYLRQRTPEYMIPAQFIQLQSFPMTTTRKVDRKALPDPGEIDRTPETENVAPRTDTERFLADCWRDVLSVDGIGVFDNFFEVGGHSLLATRIISRIRQQFQIELELRRLFEAPTIAQLADSIEDQLIADIEALSEEEAEHLLAADLADG